MDNVGNVVVVASVFAPPSQGKLGLHNFVLCQLLVLAIARALPFGHCGVAAANVDSFWNLGIRMTLV